MFFKFCKVLTSLLTFRRIVYIFLFLSIVTGGLIFITADLMFTASYAGQISIVATFAVFFITIMLVLRSLAASKDTVRKKNILSDWCWSTFGALLFAGCTSYALISGVDILLPSQLVVKSAIVLSEKKHYYTSNPDDYSLIIQVQGKPSQELTLTSFNYKFLDMHNSDPVKIVYKNSFLGRRVVAIYDENRNQLIKAKYLPYPRQFLVKWL